MQTNLPYSSRPIQPGLVDLLPCLKPGMKIKVTQTVRVGSTKTWQTTVSGVFRHVDSLATGIATDRRPQDDIIVPIVHFTKENGELTSIALDENTNIEIV